MTSKQQLSDEILNAYIDQELDDQEMLRVQFLLSESSGLQRRLDVLQQLKTMVRSARPGNTPEIPLESEIDQKDCRCHVTAAAVVLMFAGWLMWALFPIDEHKPLSIETALGTELTTTKTLFDTAQEDTAVKVVLLVNRDEKQAGKFLFDQIDMLLAAAKRRHVAVRIEVLANGDGLTLLRSDMSPYAKKIHDIQNRYDNVIFIACADTIKRRKLSLADLNLFPEVMVVSSVSRRISLRQSQGWNVIQV